jgi:hypothetical protein
LFPFQGLQRSLARFQAQPEGPACICAGLRYSSLI